MMKIKNTDLPGLTHSEHFQFHTENIALVEKYQPEAIGLDFLYPDYRVCLQMEKQVLERVGKSEISEAISSADSKQEATFAGFWEAVKAGEKHYDYSIRKAAENIRSVLEQYNGISEKTYDEEVTAFNYLIEELHNRYLPEITIMKMEGWLDELRKINKELELWVKRRFSEGIGKNAVSMKESRRETDKMYRKMTEWIEALAVVNGEIVYAGFMYELNEQNERYNQILIRRRMVRLPLKQAANGHVKI